MLETRGVAYTVVLLSIILLLTGCSANKTGLVPMDINDNGLILKYGCAQGTVRDEVTNVPLDNVLLFIHSSNHRRPISVTNDMGFYRFDILQEGYNTIIAQRVGYAAEAVEVFIIGEQTLTTDIYLDRTAGCTPFWGDITGRVFSSITETPIEGLLATIEWYGISDITNNEGEFHLYSIPMGFHVLQIFENENLVYAEDVQVISDTVSSIGTIYLNL